MFCSHELIGEFSTTLNELLRGPKEFEVVLIRHNLLSLCGIIYWMSSRPIKLLHKLHEYIA